MSQNLNVQNLDFQGIKDNLIGYMKNQQEFKDYDFTASGMNILMDVLAYNTHYMGFYAHMLANESFIDSAQTLSGMTSKAKLMNYVPDSSRSASADVDIQVDINAGNEPSNKKVVINRGTEFNSDNNAQDNRVFVLLDDVFIYNESTILGQYDYTVSNVAIHEGHFSLSRYLVDNTLLNQRYIIRSENIDIKTIQVDVYETDQESNFVTYKRADDFTQIDKDSEVYFIAVNEEGYYEIFFGNNVYGKQLANANYIKVSYLETSGVEGNFATLFSLTKSPYTYELTTVKISDGGLDKETIEELRFNIPYHYRRQNRCVTTDDYKNILMAEYRNINSISVWGGEDNDPKQYGAVFISIKPKFGELLSSKSKDTIIKILQRFNTATINPIIIDPDFLYINLDIQTNWNPLKTNLSVGQLRAIIEGIVSDYNVNDLNKFGSFYSDATLSARIIASDPSAFTTYNNIGIEKRFEPILYSPQTYYVEFNNPIVKGSVLSEEFIFRMSRSYFKDDNQTGLIHIYYWDEFKNEFVVYPDETFGVVDYDLGQVRLTNFQVDGLYTNTNLLAVHSTPKNPDFFTVRNNILTISQSVVTLVENYQNER